MRGEKAFKYPYLYNMHTYIKQFSIKVHLQLTFYRQQYYITLNTREIDVKL